jgi:predicted membrane channel-forming protein YqfA (hemolysin III family)
MLYLFLKDTHNLLRWVVVLACLWALFRVWSGLFSRREWTKADQLAGLFFTTLLNVQFLLGLILYALSPLTRSALSDFAAAMKDGTLRFYAVEHAAGMVLAVVIAQVGFSLSKRRASDDRKFRTAVIFYSISALLILASTPWPFMKYGRPLFPSFGG